MSEQKKIIKVAVRQLIEYVLRSGNLDYTFIGSNRRVQGIWAHKKIQDNQKDNYKSEVPISIDIGTSNFILQIGGRIDGLIIDEDKVTIDEIKSTTKRVEEIDENYNEMHWAQAKFYAYMYMCKENLEQIDVWLTYVEVESELIKRIKKTYTYNTLKKYFYNIVDKYILWMEKLERWNNEKIISLNQIKFPYDRYREGQKELVIATYKTIEEGKKLFVNAPTGIGKTLATLFPALKAIGRGYGDKLFYLTAKTVGRTVAEDSLDKMRQKGLKLKSITLTAKDKICFCKESKCNVDECIYTIGYFNKINEAIKDIYEKEDKINKETVEKYAYKYEICPFEFSLDLCLFMDCIICDYNYIFDPRVSLKRLLEETSNRYIFLVDEAHNLVERSRSMYSAELYKNPILQISKKIKIYSSTAYENLKKLNKYFIEVKKIVNESNDNTYIQKQFPKETGNLIKKIVKQIDSVISKNKVIEFKEELLELFFMLNTFVKVLEGYDEKYITYYEYDSGDIKCKLYCIDPSKLLMERQKLAKSTIMFSATLIPIDYFINILGGSDETYKMLIKSPFPKENLCLIINNSISTKYRQRNKTYIDVVENINSSVMNNKGNYMIFFPSYKYLEEVYELFLCFKHDQVTAIKQERFMTEEEKNNFLGNFKKNNSKYFVAFVVLGGSFSEGIDLVGERLSGVVVVGVGLPQICLEKDIIKDYFNNQKINGFEYAYIYPGMNKVMQAVGRVIRSENDLGVVVLLDERFCYNSYSRLFPRHWEQKTVVNSEENISQITKDFWDR